MKILHVAPYFAPAWDYGGTPRAVWEIAKQQVQQGHQVRVLTTDAGNNNRRQRPLVATIKGIKIFRLPNASTWLCGKFHFVTPVANIFSISNLIRDSQIVHLHEVRTLLNVLVLAKIGPRQQVVLSPWGTLGFNRSQVLIKKIWDKLFLFLFQTKVQIVCGQTHHELLTSSQFHLGRKRVLLPLGIDPENKRYLLPRLVARRKLKLPAKARIYLYLGRYSPLKGIELLLQAFNQLAMTKPDALLIMVGRDDGYLTIMKALLNRLGLATQVKILGPRYGRSRWLFYRSADYFIYTPTVDEETSTACLEALLSGTRVVTTKQAEIPDLNISDGVSYVRPTVHHLYQQLMKIYDQPPLPPNLSKINKIFSWPSIARQLTKVYAEAKE